MPPFVGVDDNVTIVYDASLGNGTLANTSQSVYMHVGLITNNSNSPTDWKHVQGAWGTADPNVLMTSMGNNLYSKTFNIRTFFGVPLIDTVYQMAFVLRNADGSLVGRAADGSDIYVDLYGPGLKLKIERPFSL